jgi:transcriptional regulator with XRE-family HTH domain
MLKNARIKKKMSQIKLANKLNISQSYLSQLEHNKRYYKNVTIDLIKKISIELELDPIDVFFYFYNKS